MAAQLLDPNGVKCYKLKAQKIQKQTVRTVQIKVNVFVESEYLFFFFFSLHINDCLRGKKQASQTFQGV